jgi:hypothetical protein
LATAPALLRAWATQERLRALTLAARKRAAALLLGVFANPFCATVFFLRVYFYQVFPHS